MPTLRRSRRNTVSSPHQTLLQRAAQVPLLTLHALLKTALSSPLLPCLLLPTSRLATVWKAPSHALSLPKPPTIVVSSVTCSAPLVASLAKKVATVMTSLEAVALVFTDASQHVTLLSNSRLSLANTSPRKTATLKLARSPEMQLSTPVPPQAFPRPTQLPARVSRTPPLPLSQPPQLVQAVAPAEVAADQVATRAVLSLMEVLSLELHPWSPLP